jgi:hypothetical protein
MARGKVGAVRLVANWALIEPTDDAWRFGALDNYVGDLAASGIRPFPVLFNTSPFVGSDPLRLPVHSAQDKQQWKEFVAMVAQRYGPGGAYWTTQYPIDHPGEQPSPVKALQVWNEQNGSKHAHDPDPSEYAELVYTWRDLPKGDSPCAGAPPPAFSRPTAPSPSRPGSSTSALPAGRELYRRVVS